MDRRRFLKEIFRIIFPPVCAACGRKIPEGVVCERCKSSIRTRNGFACPECSRRLPAGRHGLFAGTNPPPCHPNSKFVLAAASSYSDPTVRELIHALKYREIKSALNPLSEIINEYLKSVNGEENFSGFTVVPVPLHPKKERKRGFNQAELIARVISKELGIMIQENNLVRTIKTKSQTEVKNHKERERNIAGCFAVKNPEFIAGKNIILVDDVFTSGATMREAVKILKKHGARKIVGFVIAKA